MLAHQTVLTEMRPDLVNNLGVNDVIDHLVAGHHITLDEEEDLSTTQGNRSKVRKLINILHRKPVASFHCLCDSLEKTGSGYLARQLYEKLQDVSRRGQDPSTYDIDPTQIRIQKPNDNEDQTDLDDSQDWFKKISPLLQTGIPTDSQLSYIALDLTDVDILGSALGLSHTTIQQRKLDNSQSVVLQVISVLQVWKQKYHKQATLIHLVEALNKYNLLTVDLKNKIEKEFCGVYV